MTSRAKKGSQQPSDATPRKVRIEEKRKVLVATTLDGGAVALMTAREICEYLQIGRSTLKRYVNNGLIPVIRMGGNIRFDVVAVRTAIERNS